MSNKKKLTPEQKSERKTIKNKKKRTKTIIGVSIAAAVVICATVAIVLISQYTARANQLYDVTWVPVSARNASEDEVDVQEIYDVYYSNYQGSLKFNKDGTFDFWMAPGLPDDGTHTGTFELDGDTIKVTFDEGTQTDFYIRREDGYIKTIKLGYNDYTVYLGESPNK